MKYQYEYPRPAVAVDLVVFQMERKRRMKGHSRKLLLILRKNEPFADQWALPGGFLDEGETLEQAAERELMEETGVTCNCLKQLGAWSKVNRDPRTRVISVSFLAEIAADQNPVAADDAKDARWFAINDLPKLAFDHDEMIECAIESIRTPFIG